MNATVLPVPTVEPWMMIVVIVAMLIGTMGNLASVMFSDPYAPPPSLWPAVVMVVVAAGLFVALMLTGQAKL